MLCINIICIVFHIQRRDVRGSPAGMSYRDTSTVKGALVVVNGPFKTLYIAADSNRTVYLYIFMLL